MHYQAIFSFHYIPYSCCIFIHFLTYSNRGKFCLSLYWIGDYSRTVAIVTSFNSLWQRAVIAVSRFAVKMLLLNECHWKGTDYFLQHGLCCLHSQQSPPTSETCRRKQKQLKLINSQVSIQIFSSNFQKNKRKCVFLILCCYVYHHQRKESSLVVLLQPNHCGKLKNAK